MSINSNVLIACLLLTVTVNIDRYRKPMPPPRLFFLGTWSKVYPAGVTSLIVFVSLSPGLSHVSVIARRSISGSITLSIRRSVLFLIDRALTSPKFTVDTAMRRLKLLRGTPVLEKFSNGTVIRLSLRSIVVVAVYC